MYLPSNGAIATGIVTTTYIFTVTKFQEMMIFNIWKTARASEKFSSMTIIEDCISYRMTQLQMLYILNLTYIFTATTFLEIM